MSDLFDVPSEDIMGREYYDRPEATDREREVWSKVYSQFLMYLTLRASDEKLLIERAILGGLLLGYRSISPTLAARALKAIDLPNADIPGIIYKGGNPHLTVDEGLLCPVRNPYGSIVAYQVRTGDPERKYVWLSSRRSPKVAACHWALNDLESSHLTVVEGPIKADSFAVNRPISGSVIGVPGVMQWRRAKDEIEAQEAMRKEAGCPLFDTVSIAYDMDWYSKDGVKRAMQDLYAALAVDDRKVNVLLWPAQYKGVDDYLASGGTEFEIWVPEEPEIGGGK